MTFEVEDMCSRVLVEKGLNANRSKGAFQCRFFKYTFPVIFLNNLSCLHFKPFLHFFLLWFLQSRHFPPSFLLAFFLKIHSSFRFSCPFQNIQIFSRVISFFYFHLFLAFLALFRLKTFRHLINCPIPNFFCGNITLFSCPVIFFSLFPSDGILEQSMGASNRVGIGLSYRTARLHRLAKLIPWNRFLGSLNGSVLFLSV